MTEIEGAKERSLFVHRPNTSRERIRDFLFRSQEPPSLAKSHDEPSLELRKGEPFPFVIAIIPAYNEELSIVKTIEGLRDQSRHAVEIIVLADNCTDETVGLALAEGVSVVETVGNSAGKAGGLNFLLAQLLPMLDEKDCILVMDADTVLSPRFIEATVRQLTIQTERPIGGVGGIFLADDDEWNLVRQLQANEYTRYRRRLGRRKGRALVLTGTGTIFLVKVLREVAASRIAGRLPDPGKGRAVYDVSALTEDNELSICIKSLGYRILSPKQCTVATAMMPTWFSLYKQRRRWQRGALENLIAHRVNRHTAPYIARQLMTYLGVFFLPFYLYTLTISLVTNSNINFLQPLWILVALVYVFEQTFSVRKGGWRAILLSLSVLPELALNIFLDVVYIASFDGALFAEDEAWGRMRHLSKLDMEKNGKPHETVMRNQIPSLYGTHKSRMTRKQYFIPNSIIFALVAVFSVATLLPIYSLQTAWNIISVYVVIGFVATLGRLIPVRTS